MKSRSPCFSHGSRSSSSESDPDAGRERVHGTSSSRARLTAIRVITPDSPSTAPVAGLGAGFTDILLQQNNFVGNSVAGVSALTDTAVDARMSWWGSVKGPFNPISNLTGTGNAAPGNVLFKPFLTVPVVCGVAPRLLKRSALATLPCPYVRFMFKPFHTLCALTA